MKISPVNDTSWLRIFDGVVMNEELKDASYFIEIFHIEDPEKLKAMGLDTKRAILFHSDEYEIEGFINNVMSKDPSYMAQKFPYEVKVANAISNTLVTPHTRDSIYSSLIIRNIERVSYLSPAEAHAKYGNTPFGVVEIFTK